MILLTFPASASRPLLLLGTSYYQPEGLRRIKSSLSQHVWFPSIRVLLQPVPLRIIFQHSSPHSPTWTGRTTTSQCFFLDFSSALNAPITRRLVVKLSLLGFNTPLDWTPLTEQPHSLCESTTISLAAHQPPPRLYDFINPRPPPPNAHLLIHLSAGCLGNMLTAPRLW